MTYLLFDAVSDIKKLDVLSVLENSETLGSLGIIKTFRLLSLVKKTRVYQISTPELFNVNV